MSTVVLEAESISAGYSAGVSVIDGVDLHVDAGEVVGLFGANGSGKTTTLLTLAGELRAQRGAVRWKGSATHEPLHRMARRGLSFVTEERSIFPSLSVHDNLRLSRGKPEATYEMFPELAAIRARRAGLLSGGEQQMLALARAICARPEVILVDELSLGLAPMIVTRLLQVIRDAAGSGIGVLLVEQQLHVALDIVDRAYVLQGGRVQLAGTRAEVVGEIATIEAAYFG